MPLARSKSHNVIIHWPRLGPYHIARLDAAATLFAQHGYTITALEIHQGSDDYLWSSNMPGKGFKRATLFPKSDQEDIPKLELTKHIWQFLTSINPFAVAINGYSSWDSLWILFWCRVNHRFSILMSESKLDDVPRTFPKERLKQVIIKQYNAALCGGRPHREYLTSFRMPNDRIFDGYDAVDNHFFMQNSEMVRKMPDEYRSYPGLEDHHPFFLASGRFLPRKNYLSLVQAYQIYKQRCLQANRKPWHLVLLGDGVQRQELIQAIEDNQLQSEITLAGVRSYHELPAYYGLAGAFIHPALQDQWGLVVNEAMASGIPVLVSTSAGCAKDLVQDGIEGFVFNPEEVTGLANLMYKLCFSGLDLRNMGHASQNKIALWGTDRFAINLYRAVMLGTKETK